MLPREVMPPETAFLFEKLRDNPLLQPFTLIGGTALALHIGHRLSEDLDFITIREKLPRATLARLIEELRSEGHAAQVNDDPAAYDDFTNAGMDLHDYSQSWLIGGTVKLTFFVTESRHARILESTGEENRFEIASLEKISQLKAIVATSRSKSRDWLDLFILERDHGFGLSQWKSAYQKAGLTDWDFENALNRICRGIPQRDDEQFAALIAKPPSLEEIVARFRELRSAYEIETSHEVFQSALAPNQVRTEKRRG